MERVLTTQTTEKIGKTVTVKGWVNSVRRHGQLVFIDLRDRSGLLQIVFHPDFSKTAFTTAKELKDNYVVSVTGPIKERAKDFFNDKIETGKIEMEAKEIEIISAAETLPFQIDTPGYDIKEELRLKYRYLDIRRPRMTYNLRIKSKFLQFVRQFLTKEGFVEIETPMLTKSTPEGARDFLVPSRLQQGKFYALPQSPQQYKQLLMVAGLERYFQLARCFRDEDPRADRAYGEFTQLDMEMSFVSQEDILQLTERLFTSLVKELFPHKKFTFTPWPRIPHQEAKAKYHTDKPDLRKNKQDKDELAFAWVVDFPLFTQQSEDDFFYGSGKAKFAPSHHMFTAPHPDDISLLDTDPLKVRGLQHDLVLNGFEVGGGSIRIHDPKVQQKVFDLIGFTPEQKKEFSHMLEAFTYGVPPHGGIAPGVDRFLMAMLGEPTLREVIAFPAIASGKTAVMDAPSYVTQEQLDELSLAVKDDSDKPAFDRIISLLKKQKIPYELYQHEPVTTSEEAAKVRNTNIAAGAKALVAEVDGSHAMFVLPGDKKIDFKQIKNHLQVKDAALVDKDTVQKITSVEVGAVPPLGNLFKLPVYFDTGLQKQKKVVFNAGDRGKSIEILEKDLEKLVGPEVFAFAKE